MSHALPVPTSNARYDPNGETYVVSALDQRRGGPGGDNTANGAVVIPFDTTQITSRENRANPKAGDPCHPLAAGAHAPAVASPMSVRRLTPAECEKLQAFPPGWTCLCQPLSDYADDPEAAAERCTCPDSSRYRQMGNAVTVSVVTWIGQRLLAALTASR